MRLEDHPALQQLDSLSGEQKRHLARAAQHQEVMIQRMVRWLTGAHVGALIGSMSLIGTTIAADKFTDWLMVPVLIFTVGLMAIGLHAFFEISHAQRSMIDAWPGYARLMNDASREISPLFETVDVERGLEDAGKSSPFWLLVSLVSFPIGVLVGLLTLLFVF